MVGPGVKENADVAKLYIAPSTGAMSLHEPVKKYVLNVGAPYQAEAIIAVKHLTTIGITRIAIVHVDDGFDKDGLTALRAAGSFAKTLGANARGVIVTQVFPSERNPGHPFVSEALALATAKGFTELTPSMLEGFASAKVLVEALNRTSPNPTRAELQRTLENFQPYDLGGKLDGLFGSRQSRSGPGGQRRELATLKIGFGQTPVQVYSRQ